jgi:hypothetical protein
MTLSNAPSINLPDDPWTASNMKIANARFETPMRDFLTALVHEPAQHARFLNMLSMLEHLGSRKIMVSQMNRILTEDILKHLAEEARHAYFFKRQAERVAKKPLDGFNDDNTMCRIPAAMYFGRMDAGISKAVQPSPLIPLPEGRGKGAERQGEGDPYYWVSLIIELRACWLYAIYHEVLQTEKISISLKSLLAEEDMHLAEMFAMCGTDHAQLKALSAFETGLFEKMFGFLQKSLGADAPMNKAA